ncbi:MAG: alanine racemase [Gammaproteobacteria bacterium AqS3]|nr:alanine racemase [Gammaproteobacteria bacterium AqS3]
MASSGGGGLGAQPLLRVSLPMLAENYAALCDLAGPARLGAVVKSDAYGLGLLPVAEHLARSGCDLFLVAWLDEGIALRERLGPDAEIWIMHGVEPGGQDECSARGLIPVLNDPDQIARWSSSHADHPAVLNIDTGMNRLGVDPGQLPGVIAFRLHALMSHLASSGRPDSAQNAEQLARLHRAAGRLGSAHRAPISLANTGGVLLGADYRFDICRCGIGLYGGILHERIAPVVELHTQVLQVRRLRAGESVGYNARWCAPAGGAQIAVIAAGYADGWLFDGGWARVGGVRVPMVGEVSMDLITLDVTGLEVQPGDPVALADAQLTVPELSRLTGRSSYDILTGIGARFRREYVLGAEP